MKKLMILGAAYTQTPLYEAAGRLGYATVAASIPGDWPGFSLADECAYVNIADPEAVAEAAEKFHADGIATCGLDLGMRAIGETCSRLGLNGPSREAARIVSDKSLMKEAFVRGGVSTARFCKISTEEELEDAMQRLPFPVILKAVDLMGSRGIYRSNTPEEARINFRKSMSETGKDYCLIEEFIEGELFGVEAMISGGEFLFILPNNTEAFIGAVPTPVGHSVPHKDIDSMRDVIEREVRAAVRATGLDNCPVNCDCLMKDGRVYIVEITGRPGATGLSEMTGERFGVNYYEEIVRLAMGEDLSEDFRKERERAVLARTLMAKRSGIVREILDRNEKSDTLIELSFNIGPGDTVRPYTNGRDRIGQVILSGNTLADCERELRRVESNIDIVLAHDLPVPETPIHFVMKTAGGTSIYMKREDMIPFSFGGNKVRFSAGYLADMEARGCDAMIIYGGYNSNLCRILSDACRMRGIPCSMIHNIDDAEEDENTPNARMIRAAGVREYPCHKGPAIADAVSQAMADFEREGRKPYYINGDKTGRGNVHVPMRAYDAAYEEILRYEEASGVHFSKIYLAASTCTTQSGLIAGSIRHGDGREIIGISVTRNTERASEVIFENLLEYFGKTGADVPPEEELKAAIHVRDLYLCGGYALYDDEIGRVIRETYLGAGIPLDPVYTGKAFRGMLADLEADARGEENVLFLHTGGVPLFFEYLDKNGI